MSKYLGDVVIKDGTMEQSKQDDNGGWEDSGPIRVLGRLYRETADNRVESVDAHKVVYAQEPLWVLDMRFPELAGESTVFFRVVLRPQDGPGWWKGECRFSVVNGRERRNK